MHRGIFSKILREPLVHFLVIGAAIFGLYRATVDVPESDANGQIVVTSADIEQLAGLWQRQWQRPPSAEELHELIESHVREEVLYREALALGLDRDDTIVRRRLAQKFEFLTEDLAATSQPTDSELETYFAANRERYRAPPQISFTQIYFNPDLRGKTAESDAGVVLAGLRAGSSQADDAKLGDRLILDGASEHWTPQEIESAFGDAFANAVTALDPGVWSGPIVSGYGLHLVRVDERIPARMPNLSEIEGRVRTDWIYEQRQRANDSIYASLLARYDVTIEDAPRALAAVAVGTNSGVQ